MFLVIPNVKNAKKYEEELQKVILKNNSKILILINVSRRLAGKKCMN